MSKWPSVGLHWKNKSQIVKTEFSFKAAMFILALYDHEFNMKHSFSLFFSLAEKVFQVLQGFLKKKGNETVSILFWSFYKM